MKNTLFILISIFLSIATLSSCKNKTADNSGTVTSPEASAPVDISSDDELKIGVLDATKDYPTVQADVADSVIILTGEIPRADWQKLNPTLNSLRPKRVNSDGLTIK